MNGQRVLRPEAMWFIVAATSFVVLEITLMGAWAMITRPFWLDEVSTYLVAGTQSLPESIRGLAAGADYNPPAAFILYRAVGLLAGGLTPIAARTFAAACVVGALTIVYVLLRDQFSPWPAAVGALSLWAQQVVMHAAAEARFYGPLLLAVACLLLALLRTARREPTLASRVWLAVASIVVCTVHYFGVLSWGIGMASVLLVTNSRRVTLGRLVPAIAGPLALAACIPLYVGQRATLTVPTWMADITVIEAVRLLAIFLLTMPVAIALVCWVLTEARARWAGGRIARIGWPALALGPALLLAQVAVPLVLVAFSLLVQPATEPRYWIAGAFATAPVAAFVVSRADLPIRWLATIAMVASSVKTMWGEANRADAFARRVREDVRVATQLAASGVPVVERWPDTLYPVLQQRPELRSRTAVLDSTPFDTTNRYFAIVRDLARVNRRLYGFPQIVTPAELGRLPKFYLMESEGEGAPTTEEFPGYAITRVADRAFFLAAPAGR